MLTHSASRASSFLNRTRLSPSITRTSSTISWHHLEPRRRAHVRPAAGYALLVGGVELRQRLHQVVDHRVVHPVPDQYLLVRLRGIQHAAAAARRAAVMPFVGLSRYVRVRSGCSRSARRAATHRCGR
jgi:hypothetical protein